MFYHGKLTKRINYLWIGTNEITLIKNKNYDN